MKDEKFTKKAKVEKIVLGMNAFEVTFQESGGWLKKHKPYTKEIVHKHNCKKYILGVDNILEPYDENLEKTVMEKEEAGEIFPGSPYHYISKENIVEDKQDDLQDPIVEEDKKNQVTTENQQDEQDFGTETPVIQSSISNFQNPLVTPGRDEDSIDQYLRFDEKEDETSQKIALPHKTIVKKRKKK
jgi:hypothetical protein